jgi:hypothetical protein
MREKLRNLVRKLCGQDNSQEQVKMIHSELTRWQLGRAGRFRTENSMFPHSSRTKLLHGPSVTNDDSLIVFATTAACLMILCLMFSFPFLPQRIPREDKAKANRTYPSDSNERKDRFRSSLHGTKCSDTLDSASASHAVENGFKGGRGTVTSKRQLPGCHLIQNCSEGE